MINCEIIHLLFVETGLLKFAVKKRYMELNDKLKNCKYSTSILHSNRDYILFLETLKKYFISVRENNVKDYIEILYDNYDLIYKDISRIKDKKGSIINYHKAQEYFSDNSKLKKDLYRYKNFEFKRNNDAEVELDKCKNFEFRYKGENIKFNNFHIELFNITKKAITEEKSLLINSYLPIQDSIILVLYKSLIYFRSNKTEKKKIMILTSDSEELGRILNNISISNFKDKKNGVEFHKRFSIIKSKKFKYYLNGLIKRESKNSNPEDISDILISRVNPLEFESYTLKNIKAIIISPDFFNKYNLYDFLLILDFLKKFEIIVIVLTNKLSFKNLKLMENRNLDYMLWSQHELKNLYDNSIEEVISYFEVVLIEDSEYEKLLEDYCNIFNNLLKNKSLVDVIDYNYLKTVKNFYLMLKRKKLVFSKNYSSEINHYSETGIVNLLKDKYPQLDYIFEELFILDYNNLSYINNKLKYILDEISSSLRLLILVQNKEEVMNLKNYLKEINIKFENVSIVYNINIINLNNIDKIIVPGNLSKEQINVLLDSNFKKVHFLIYNFEKNTFYNNLKRKVEFIDKIFHNRLLNSDYDFSKYNILKDNLLELLKLNLDSFDEEAEFDFIKDMSKENKIYFKDKPEKLLLTFDDNTNKEVFANKLFYILISNNNNFDLEKKHGINLNIGDLIYFPTYEFSNKLDLLKRYIFEESKFYSVLKKFEEYRKILLEFYNYSGKQYSDIAQEISGEDKYKNISNQTIKDFFEINILCPESIDKFKLICKSINYLVEEDVYIKAYKVFKLVRNKSFELNKQLHELCVKKYLNELSKDNKYEIAKDINLSKLVAENTVKEIIGIKNG